MTTTSAATSCEQTLHAAFERCENSRLLKIQVPRRDNPGKQSNRQGMAADLC